MTDTKELLQRIAALRTRLSMPASEAIAMAPEFSNARESLRAVELRVQSGTEQDALIEGSLNSAEPNATPAASATTRLTGRGARVLRRGREMLHALRQISEDADFQEIDPTDALMDLHAGAMAMLEVLLRSTQTFPPVVSAQLRLCDGLESILGEIEERIEILGSGLALRKHTAGHISELADYLHALAVKQPVGLGSFQGLADTIIAEAKAGVPLRFLYTSPAEPARFIAAHSLTVAQVLARILRDDDEWQPQLQLALMAALVHDVGMVRVPSEILLTQGPLDGEERRLIEKHTTVAESMLEKLWPGGGWPLDAARDHHERNDGTGYPQGMRDIKISPYARLLAVCDVYAALGAERPHRPAFDSRTALTEVLMLAERNFLDSTSAERLLLLSFYPVGSAVELNDGAVGLVIGTHAGQHGIANPGKPIVLLESDAHGQPTPWPTVVDLLAENDRTIVRGLHAEERKKALGHRYPSVCV